MTSEISLDLLPTIPVIKIEDNGTKCQHIHTRPATKSDQRPMCVNCLTIVGDAANLSIYRKFKKVGGDVGISTAYIKLNDDELGALIDALVAVQNRRLGE